MKYVSLLVGALSLATLSLSSPALGDPVDDYTRVLLTNLDMMCRNTDSAEVRNGCLSMKTKMQIELIEVQIEQEKDQGCLRDREVIEQGYSKLPLTPECQERVAAWDKEYPDDRQSELEYLHFIQNQQ